MTADDAVTHAPTAAATPAAAATTGLAAGPVDLKDVYAAAGQYPDTLPPADLKALYAEAVQITRAAVAAAEDVEKQERDKLGRLLREEQDALYDALMRVAPIAVRDAAFKGRRTATLLTFDGPDKLHDFCYLYMIKGPYLREQRDEMRAMGASPLLPRLRAEFRAAGFDVHHSWQRATNTNTLTVTW